MTALAIVAIVIALGASIAAAIAAGLRARRRLYRSRRLLHQLDSAHADLRSVREERDQLQARLAHALRAQEQLEHERDDAEAEAYSSADSFEATLRDLRASRDQALRERDGLATELDQAYLAGAAIVAGLTQERDRAELREGRALNRSIAHRRTIDALRDGLTCADLGFDEELPPGPHDRPDCPCGHPRGEQGPCAMCNCADQWDEVDQRIQDAAAAAFDPEDAREPDGYVDRPDGEL